MAVKLIRGLSLYGSIDQVWQTAVPGFYIIGNCISYYIKKPPAGCALRRTMMMSQTTAAGARICQCTFFIHHCKNTSTKNSFICGKYMNYVI